MKISHYPQRREGVALIITLSIIVLVCILVVGFADTSRLERSAARAHVERARATMLAQEGLDRVSALIDKQTSNPQKRANETADAYARRVRHWISQPGRLLVPDPANANDQKRLVKAVSLSSGAVDPATVYPYDLRPPNLNVTALSDPTVHLIAEEQINGAVVKMPVRWIYQRQDGALEKKDGALNDLPLLNDTINPLTGRFAYWSDDETTKINTNLAYTRDALLNKNPPGHPTKIDLGALPGFLAPLPTTLHEAVTSNNYTDIRRFFNSPFDARRLDNPALRAALDLNKFNLTHFNQDPDTTYFDRPRLVLTTQKANAGGRPFLDILTTDNSDPGTVQSINGGKLATVIDTLVNDYLKRSDWPMVEGSGHSLQEKYYEGKPERLAQLALNIVDYVRSAESARILVEPIRAKYKGTIFTGDWVDTGLRGQDDTYKGLTRSLQITEMGVWVDQFPVAPPPPWNPKDASGKIIPLHRVKFFVELNLPESYGLASVDLRNPVNLPNQHLFLYVWPATQSSRKHYEPAWKGRPTWTSPAAGEETFFRIYGPNENSEIPNGNVLEATNDPTKMIMKAGEYRTLVLEFYVEKPLPPAAQLTSYNLRAAISTGVDSNNNGRLDGGFNARYDVTPLGDVGSGSSLSYVLDAPQVPENSISSVEVDDPRVNGVSSDWKSLRGSNTFGRKNKISSVGLLPGINYVPEQDVDEGGKISDASLRMPFQKGNAQNPNGRVRSSGELGNIHTGIEGRSKGVGGGVPWRTLRLQPSKQGRSVVPDWAFMDLFTVPADVPPKAVGIFSPHGNTTGGRVNMNAKPEPFDMERINPLAAVLLGCRKDSRTPTDVISADEAKTLARNIYARVLAPASGPLPAGKQYGETSPELACYESPGEVVEMKGIADRGEASEELVREIANLITARGGVFSVYTLGQALKQTPGGKLVVTAEQRQHALVERFVDTKGTTTETDDEVKLRTVYFRNLLP